jgi:hypothetical protein
MTMSDDYTGNGTNCGLGMVYETLEEKEIERQRKQITTLRQQLSAYRESLQAVSDLINGSYGVSGLHLNGDIAPWEELLEGGRFEEWLSPFSQALAGDTKKE